MIDEFVTILSDCVEQYILSKAKACAAIGILCDESTYAANLKQIVVFICFLVKGVSHKSTYAANLKQIVVFICFLVKGVSHTCF